MENVADVTQYEGTEACDQEDVSVDGTPKKTVADESKAFTFEDAVKSIGQLPAKNTLVEKNGPPLR